MCRRDGGWDARPDLRDPGPDCGDNSRAADRRDVGRAVGPAPYHIVCVRVLCAWSAIGDQTGEGVIRPGARAVRTSGSTGSTTHAKALAGLANIYALRHTYTTESGDLETAMSFARRATEADPTLAEPHVWLGYALMRSGRLTEAETSLRRARELNGSSFYALLFWPGTAIQLGRLDEGLRSVAAPSSSSQMPASRGGHSAASICPRPLRGRPVVFRSHGAAKCRSRRVTARARYRGVHGRVSSASGPFR